ncbi:MAG: hypothetical protein AAFO07_04105 [Bacteroidota bacterium]
MKARNRLHILYLILGLLASYSFLNPVQAQGLKHFITTEGDQLMNGEEPFRFISFNIPNLNYIEDEMAFHETNPYGLPNEYEMRDALSTIKEMGGQVIRMYTFPVYSESFPEDAPTYVEGPGKFNERAFRTMDTLLALANEYEIRIIIPFINNWKWMGGRPDFTAFHDKPTDAFWTDPKIIKDFKKTIKYILNRKNTVTGIKYKEDKAILCWQSGNELQSPVEWVLDIAKFVKKNDKNHLFMDGYYSLDHHPFHEESITSEYVDIITTHHYEANPAHTIRNIKKKAMELKGRKPMVITEFGFISTSAIETFLDTVIQHQNIAGALIWSLRYHHRNGGFYWHSEPMGSGLYKAYHWPGFTSGHQYDEANLMQTMRNKAFEIQNKPVPPVSIPSAPEMLPIMHVSCIKWRGVMGSCGYNIERADSPEGPWTVVGFNVSDANNPVFPGFHDKTAKIGATYYYRAKAMNSSGISDASEAVGPVLVGSQKVIDDMENKGICFHASENIQIETSQNRSYKEDLSRMTGKKGDELIYFVPGQLQKMDIYCFEKKEEAISVWGSTNNEDFFPLEAQAHHYINSETNYDYDKPVLYRSPQHNVVRYIKIKFEKTASLSRVEIEYTDKSNNSKEALKP